MCRIDETGREFALALWERHARDTMSRVEALRRAVEDAARLVADDAVVIGGTDQVLREYATGRFAERVAAYRLLKAANDRLTPLVVARLRRTFG